ncbi:MAG: creatininase family protein [Cocleimonas sp.]
MNKQQSFIVETSTWKDVQQALQRDLICIVPIGAASKEHGLHLPLNTDFIQAQYLSQQLAQNFPLIVWPVISFGYYPAFTDYPGSWSISEQTFINSMLDIIESIAKHGNNRIVLLNTGISTISPLKLACKQTPFSSRISLLNIYSGPHTRKVKDSIQQQQQGGHADEFETSVMLAIDETLVKMELAEAGLEDIQCGSLNLSHPDQPNYCPTGSMGNPTFASKEKGQQILDAMLEDLSEYISRISKK